MTPVILSGGGGTRLWPVSRPAMPKQFAELLDESLFKKTLKRLMPLGKPWIVTVRQMQTLTEMALAELGQPDDQVIYEPIGKNTGPSIALICKKFELMGRADEVVGVFPADHLIGDEEKFREAVRAGEVLAASGHVVTLGVKSTYPATGYGYIETSGAFNESSSDALSAVGFREKPNEETARDFLSRGEFFWNAGMFIFRVSTMIELFAQYAPDIWQKTSELKPDFSNLDAVYSRFPSTSIDYATMERLPKHICLPCTFEWNDLGSWDSMAALLTPEKNVQNIYEVEATRNFVVPNGKKIYAFVGIDNLIVVDTADAVLIAKRGETELVKQLVDKLKSRS